MKWRYISRYISRDTREMAMTVDVPAGSEIEVAISLRSPRDVCVVVREQVSDALFQSSERAGTG